MQKVGAAGLDGVPIADLIHGELTGPGGPRHVGVQLGLRDIHGIVWIGLQAGGPRTAHRDSVQTHIRPGQKPNPSGLGSVLLYTTPKLAGIQWDEHGDGCMHKSGGGGIHDQEPPFPVWLRLVRHGDTFSGYTSGDGEHWGDPWSTDPVPGLADAMDIGIAAGTIDQVPALVELEDFALELEDIG